MAKRLPDRPVLCLELLAGVTVFLPGLREFAIGIADFGEPRLPIGDLQADNAPGQGDPFPSVIGDRLRGFIKAALRLTNLICDVADVHKALAVKLRPVVEDADNVGARARLNGRGDTSLDVVSVDGLDVELHAERFLALCSNLPSKQLVGSRNEVVPAQPMERRDLSVRGSATGSENARHPTHPGRHYAARKFYEATPIQAFHGILSLEFLVKARLYGQPRRCSRARWGAEAH